MIFTATPGRWIAGFVALLLTAMALGNEPLLTVSAFVLTFVLVAALLKPAHGVTVERGVSRSTCWVGDEVDVRRVVTVEGGIGPLFIYDAIPDEMQVERGNNYQVVWKWPGRRIYDVTYTLRCPKRGEFALRETEWNAESPAFRMGRHQGTGGGEQHVAIVPRLVGVQRLANARAKAVSLYPNADPSKIGIATTNFQELRPYQPGDPVRSINWKASARSGRSDSLLVNKYETEGRRAVWLFLDGASYMEVGTTIANPLEQALEAASAIGHFYLSRGYTLGAYVYNNTAGFLSPDMGHKQFRRLSQKLLTVRAEPDFRGLRPAVEWSRHYLARLQPQTIVLTRLDAHFANPEEGEGSWGALLEGTKKLASMGGNMRLRAPVWLVNVGGHAYLDRGERFEPSASEMLQWETAPMGRELRRAGVSLLDWNPIREPFAMALHRHLRLSRMLR